MVEYTNSVIKELIAEYIHNSVDRKMVFDRLVNGYTFEKISGIYLMDIKTVRKRIHRCENEIFKHIPG